MTCIQGLSLSLFTLSSHAFVPHACARTYVVQAFVCLYWTDSRMIGWEGALPDNLWGPWCNCRNGIRADMDVDDHEFVLGETRKHTHTITDPHSFTDHLHSVSELACGELARSLLAVFT